ncbi:hypothetical protein RDI58_028914 [Solanum bulbocastanum]|uniref:Uncharacterized protein n=1 Tax=Solanum bulbocastanum TaxID=147425 RepID=A0AAN8SX59_SOLBU
MVILSQNYKSELFSLAITWKLPDGEVFKWEEIYETTNNEEEAIVIKEAFIIVFL